MGFWENVEVLRKQQNTSYRWLAQVLEVSETTISSMRRNRTEPRASDAMKIAKALGTTVEFLCTNESDSYYLKYVQLKEELSEILQKY